MITYESFSGSGPGGQHRNRKKCCVRATDTDTGLVAVSTSERSLRANKKKAKEELLRKVAELETGEKAAAKKERRDKAIKETGVVRTYNYSRSLVKDHRTGKTASLKDVLGKGRIDLLK